MVDGCRKNMNWYTYIVPWSKFFTTLPNSPYVVDRDPVDDIMYFPLQSESYVKMSRSNSAYYREARASVINNDSQWWYVTRLRTADKANHTTLNRANSSQAFL